MRSAQIQFESGPVRLKRVWNWLLCRIYGRCGEVLPAGGRCALSNKHLAYHETFDGTSWCYDVDGELVVSAARW